MPVYCKFLWTCGYYFDVLDELISCSKIENVDNYEKNA